MSDGDNGLLLLFPMSSNTLDLSRYKDSNSSVYVYTEIKGSPIVNYCEKCCRPFYSILSVNSKSVMSTHVKISRCTHALGVTSYLRSLGERN